MPPDFISAGQAKRLFRERAEDIRLNMVESADEEVLIAELPGTTAQLRLLFLSDAHVVLEVSHGPPGGQAPIDGWILLYKERLTELGLQVEDSLTQFGFGSALDFGLAMMEPNMPPEYW